MHVCMYIYMLYFHMFVRASTNIYIYAFTYTCTRKNVAETLNLYTPILARSNMIDCNILHTSNLNYSQDYNMLHCMRSRVFEYRYMRTKIKPLNISRIQH